MGELTVELCVFNTAQSFKIQAFREPALPSSPAERAAKKEEQRREGEKNMAEYRAAKIAEEKKTERLRALRLAHEAKEAREAGNEAAAVNGGRKPKKKISRKVARRTH